MSQHRPDVRWVLLVVGAALLTWGAAFTADFSSVSGTVPRRQLAEPVPERLPSPILTASAQTSVDVLRESPKHLAAPRVTNASAVGTDAPAPMPTKEELVAADRARFTRYFAQLDDLREREALDPEWQRAVEDRVAEFVNEAKEAAGSRIESVACGSSLCRVEMKHGHPSYQDMASNALLHYVLYTATIQFLDDRSIIYIGKSDEALPYMRSELE